MQKRVLAIHDLSCFGKCSLTVALPIVSAAGYECTVMPDAILSAHTGIPGFTFKDLTEEMRPVAEHWKRLNLRFDSVFTGFLCSKEQIDIVCDLITEIRTKDTLVLVDPAMADGGELYSVFTPDFPTHMRRLCSQADVIKPNITEACLLTGVPYTPGPYSEEWVTDLLDKLSKIGARSIVLTGVYFDKDEIGAATRDCVTGDTAFYSRKTVPGFYAGTGDVFSSVLLCGLMKGRHLEEAVRTAVDFTVESINRTHESGSDPLMGVNFEEGLPHLIERLK